jgi:hypothetical protein
VSFGVLMRTLSSGLMPGKLRPYAKAGTTATMHATATKSGKHSDLPFTLAIPPSR